MYVDQTNKKIGICGEICGGICGGKCGGVRIRGRGRRGIKVMESDDIRVTKI